MTSTDGTDAPIGQISPNPVFPSALTNVRILLKQAELGEPKMRAPLPYQVTPDPDLSGVALTIAAWVIVWIWPLELPAPPLQMRPQVSMSVQVGGLAVVLEPTMVMA